MAEASLVQQHVARQRAEQEEKRIELLRERFKGAGEPLLRAALEETQWDVEEATKELREYEEAAEKDFTNSTGKNKQHKRKREKGKEVEHGKRKKEQDQEQAGTFGARGIVREGDMNKMRGEFHAWLVEVQRRSPEDLGKKEERELFKQFAEDFNTCTLPHEKYYDLEKHAREQEQAEGEQEFPSVLHDEERRKREQEEERQRRAQEEQEALKHLLRETGTKEEMMEQERTKQKLQLAYRQGDMAEVERLKNRLQPEDVAKRYGADKNYGFKPS